MGQLIPFSRPEVAQDLAGPPESPSPSVRFESARGAVYVIVQVRGDEEIELAFTADDFERVCEDGLAAVAMARELERG